MISIITVVKNGMPYLQHSINSYLSQNLLNKELIVVYSKSTDRTFEYLNSIKNKINKLIIDKKGKNKFDSINLGIKNASGEIIGILHADDQFYNNKILSQVHSTFQKKSLDILYGNCVFVKRTNPKKIIRYWRSKKFNYDNLAKGWMPPHTTIFIKKKIACTYDSGFKYSSDFDYINQIFKKGKKIFYLNKILVVMRSGGDSAKFLLRKVYEDFLIFKKNNIKIYYMFFKYLSKIKQFFIFLNDDIIKIVPKKKISFISSINQIDKKLKKNNFIIVAFNFNFFSYYKLRIIDNKKTLFWLDGYWANFFLKYTSKKNITGRDLFSFKNIGKIKCKKNIYIIGSISTLLKDILNKDKFHNYYFINVGLYNNVSGIIKLFNHFTFKKSSIAIITITSSKQELLAEYLLMKKNISSICCGAAFNMNLGVEPVPPKIFENLKLEFLWRLKNNFIYRVKRLFDSIINFQKYKYEI